MSSHLVHRPVMSFTRIWNAFFIFYCLLYLLKLVKKLSAFWVWCLMKGSEVVYVLFMQWYHLSQEFLPEGCSLARGSGNSHCAKQELSTALDISACFRAFKFFHRAIKTR